MLFSEIELFNCRVRTGLIYLNSYLNDFNLPEYVKNEKLRLYKALILEEVE